MSTPDPFLSMIEGAMAQVSKQRIADAENMTLGALIKALESVEDKSKTVLTTGGTSVGSFMSYRGYYEDLALEPCDEYRTVQHLLDEAQSVRGSVLTGYKGGKFPMHDDSIIWLAPYGHSGGIALYGTEERPYTFVLYGAPTDDC